MVALLKKLLCQGIGLEHQCQGKVITRSVDSGFQAIITHGVVECSHVKYAWSVRGLGINYDNRPTEFHLSLSLGDNSHSFMSSCIS